MMNRRVFLAALAGLPIVGRFVPKKWPHVGEVPIRVMSETPCDWELFSRRLSLTDLELDQRYRFRWRDDPSRTIVAEGVITSRLIAFQTGDVGVEIMRYGKHQPASLFGNDAFDIEPI